MNQYTQLLQYIKTLGEADDFISTITKGEDVDINKGNIFPLLHVDIVTGSFTNGQTVTFDVELSCLDIRDVSSEISTDKFWEQDNEVDYHNLTLAVLNRLWTKMYRDFAENNITASENPALQKVTDSEKNRLDGWTLSFTVEMPNTTIALC